NDIGGSLHAVIRQTHSQRAVSVTQTSGPGLAVQVIVVETALVGVPVLRTVSVERVANTKLEAREIRGLVHDHVVETGGVSCRERGTHVGLVEAQTERIDSAEVLGSDVGLTAEVDLTPGVATQTERSVTTEQATALSGVTGVETEASCGLEPGLRTVTQIFSALQSPAVTRLDTFDQAGALGAITVVGLVLLVANTAVQNTVQGHGRFCLSNAGKAKRKS